MDARLVGLGDLEIEGKRYDADVVIERGQVRRRKKPSKLYRDRFGHTLLSAEEWIPWGGPRLIVGAGADGLLPIMAEVYDVAVRRPPRDLQRGRATPLPTERSPATPVTIGRTGVGLRPRV